MVISSKPQAASRFPADFQILQIFRKLQFFPINQSPAPYKWSKLPSHSRKVFPFDWFPSGNCTEHVISCFRFASEKCHLGRLWETPPSSFFKNSWKVAHVTTAPCCLRLNIFFRTFISRDFRRARVSDWPYFVMNLNYSNNILILAYFSPSIRFFLY